MDSLSPRRKGFDWPNLVAFVVIPCATLLLVLAYWAAIITVAAHFIRKYW
jgi:hypothetical protein